MRSLAILLVVFGHYANFFYNHLSPVIPFTNLSLKRFLYLFITGLDGVDLFFVLSGFLIGHSLLIAFVKNELNFNYLIHNFWIKRWFRTLPNYIFVLISCIILYCFIPLSSEAGNNPVSTYKYFIFIQNFFSGGLLFFPESWSLSIEEWFYISFPIVLTLFAIAFKKSEKRKYVLLTCILIFIIGGTLIRSFEVTNMDLNAIKMSLWNDNFRTVILMRLDAIIYGVLMAFIKIYLPTTFTKYRYLFLILGVAILIVAFKLYFYPSAQFNSLLFSHTYYFTLVGIGMSLTLPFFYHLKINRIFWIKFFTTISVLSYSIYLVNYSIVENTLNYLIPNDAIIFGMIKCFLALVFTFTISALLYKYIETPFMNYRKKLLNE